MTHQRPPSQPTPVLDRLADVEVAVLGGVRVVPSDTDATAEAVFRAHYAPLAGWCRRMTGDEQVAHDIAAEAFARLLARWGRVNEPKAYLYTTALNLVRDRWRSAERERAALHRHGHPGADLVVADGDGPELRTLIATLSRRHQQVIVLHYYADLTVEQIAGTLGVASGTVKRDLYDARAALQKALEQS